MHFNSFKLRNVKDIQDALQKSENGIMTKKVRLNLHTIIIEQFVTNGKFV